MKELSVRTPSINAGAEILVSKLTLEVCGIGLQHLNMSRYQHQMLE